MDNIVDLASAVNRRFAVTFFDDVSGRRARQEHLTLRELADIIRGRCGASKESLPLLKLGTFGQRYSKNGSARHDDNFLAAHGVEGDYDGEVVAFEEAVAAVREAGVAGIVYTSPSHAPGKPRWRVLCPLAQPTKDRALREKFVNRLNGMVGGVLAGESWALSQAYYYGRVRDDFQIEVLEGDPIDTRDDLPEVPKRQRADGLGELPPKIAKLIKDGPGKKGDTDRSRAVFGVACALVRLGWNDAQIAAVLLDRDNGISAHVYDQSDPAGYAARQARQAREAVAADWVRDARGSVIGDNLHNVRKAVAELGIGLRYDVFWGRPLVKFGDSAEVALEDHVANAIWFQIQDRYKFKPSKWYVYDYLEDLARKASFHPVLDYLDNLSWDNTPRLNTWLSRYAGAEDTPYTRAVGRLIVIAAIRRVRQPGAKFDQMLVLYSGEQGPGKSTLIKTLAVRPEWFTDSISFNTAGREMQEQLQGKWLAEYAEMRGLMGGKSERAKATLSREVDRGRPAYRRFQSEVPRQCVFFGTTNNKKHLVDPTGNRRFWPVEVGKIDREALERDRDQLWAEAAIAERVIGKEVQLAPELWPAAAEMQEEYREEDAWEEHLREMLGDAKGKILANDVWKLLRVPVERRADQRLVTRRGEAMRALGWRHANLRMKLDGGHRAKQANAYVKGDGPYDQIEVEINSSTGEPEINIIPADPPQLDL